ncbi:MAG TPA: helix-turn-helix domain-containing protein [Thermoanaerobaculia bacterium]
MEMQAGESRADLETITSARRASALMHPLRLRLLSLSREPTSAAELARRLGLPRQRVNYHVRALEGAGFLRRAGRQRKGNMTEQRFVATARAFMLSAGILGPVAADWREIGDTTSPDYLLALTEQVRADIEQAAGEGRAEGQPITTVSLKSQFRFENAAQRAAFVLAVREAVVAVIARHASPNRLENGRPGRGRPYRLVLACYPIPVATEGPEVPGER